MMNHSKLSHGLMLLFASLLLHVPGTESLPLMDRDEPRFARATVEMMEKGTWLVPWFNDEYRFDKPPLTYWWMRIHYQLFGISELSARAHSILAAWLTACLLYHIGSRLWGQRSGLAAGLVWLGSLQVMIHARLSVADMPLLLALTAMLWALIEMLIFEDRRQRWFFLLYGSMALGFLAKGPIAMLIPALALGLARGMLEKQLPWHHLRFARGFAFSLSIIALWGIPALLATDNLFWKIGMGEHVIKRGAEVFNGRVFIPGFYLLTVFISLYPWSFLLPQLSAQAWRCRKQNAGTALLAGWFSAPLILFSFYATQLPHYIMPGFPAFALLAGKQLVSGQFASSSRLKLGLAALPGTLGIALWALSHWLVALEMRPVAMAAAFLFLTLSVIGGGACFVMTASGWRRTVGLAIILGLCTHHLCAELRSVNATTRILSATNALPERYSWLGWNYTEPSLVFYSGRKWQFTHRAQHLENILESHPDTAVVALVREWTLEGALKSFFFNRSISSPSRDETHNINLLMSHQPRLSSKAVVQGFNAARMSWVEVMLLTPVVSEQHTSAVSIPASTSSSSQSNPRVGQ